MKIPSQIIGVLVAGCLIPAAMLPRASAAITDDQFNQLKDLVTQQGQRIDQLEKIHDQDQTNHEQDQQKIQDLEKQLDETHSIATNAEQKADAASQVQPASPAAYAGPPATHNFSMVGDAEVQFGKSDDSHATFSMADFAPIFLYRAGDSTLFEAGFDIMSQNGPRAPGGTGGSSTSVSMSFATLDYLVNDYVTLEGGEMLLPLGTYAERGAGWLNKIPDDPLVRSVLPESGVGVQLRGAIPIGESGQSLTYAVYGDNGPSSIDGTANSTTLDPNNNVIPNLDLGGNVGDTPNWHSQPSGGGRIGWFMPWQPHYDLELGVSGQGGTWDDADKRSWSAAVLDAALHISPYFELKGEYINTWVDTDDIGTYKPRGLWVQAAYKLAGLNLDLPVVNDLEGVGRYDTVNDGLGNETDRYTLGYVYYLSSTLLFEGDYEWLHGSTSSTGFVLQLSYGF
jgi:hypothetical protein